jgi:hypothetical protein
VRGSWPRSSRHVRRWRPRLLYLAWLLAAQSGELDDDEVEPPVPPGLRSLTAPLRAFADFLRIDGDLIAVAAEASADPHPGADLDQDLAGWLRNLPVVDKDALLLRAIRGDAHLRTELVRRYRREQAPEQVESGQRTAGELLGAAGARQAERARLVEQRQAAERVRRLQAAAAARDKRLDALAAEGDKAWARAAALIDTKRPRDYDDAVKLLVDLRAIGEREGQPEHFARRLAQLRGQHQRKPSFIQRLDNAGLS